MTKRTFGEKMISINIPAEMHFESRQMGWTFREIFILGFLAKKENPQLLERIKELEKGNERLQTLVTKLSGRIDQVTKEEVK